MIKVSTYGSIHLVRTLQVRVPSRIKGKTLNEHACNTRAYSMNELSTCVIGGGTALGHMLNVMRIIDRKTSALETCVCVELIKFVLPKYTELGNWRGIPIRHDFLVA